MAQGRPRPSGGLEGEVLACLATARAPMTPAEVQAELGGDLAYTTVMTTLARLHAKKALTRTTRGRAYAYALEGGSRGARAGITAHQMQRLLDAGSDRATVLSRFVDGLDAKDEQVLRDLLAKDVADPDAGPPRRTRRRDRRDR